MWVRHHHRAAQMNVNCLGAVAVTKAFQPAIERSKGVICMVNSFGGVMPLKNMTAYTASKYALAGGAPSPPSRCERVKSGVRGARESRAERWMTNGLRVTLPQASRTLSGTRCTARGCTWRR